MGRRPDGGIIINQITNHTKSMKHYRINTQTGQEIEVTLETVEAAIKANFPKEISHQTHGMVTAHQALTRYFQGLTISTAIFQYERRTNFQACLKRKGTPIPEDETLVEIREGGYIQFMGHTIRRKRDFHPSLNQVGYVVIKDGCNVIPGAMWFRDVKTAQKGIAAWVLAGYIVPFEGLGNARGEVYHALMELRK